MMRVCYRWIWACMYQSRYWTIRIFVYVRWSIRACYKARSNLVLCTNDEMPNLVANLQGYPCWARDFRLWISIKGKETWRQQFESAPGYFILYIIFLLNSLCPLYCWACLLNLFWHLAKLFEIFDE